MNSEIVVIVEASITVLFSLLGLLFDVMEYICASNLYPEANDIPHIFLLNVVLHDLIVRADMLDRHISNLALILFVAS